MIIQIDKHTIERARERGATLEEIKDAIENGIIIPAKYEKLGKEKIYQFNNIRNGKQYKQKKVEVFYLIENEVIITVTVYVFYGSWED
jgi:hypothetical protein